MSRGVLLRKIKLAIPTKEDGGVKDVVSDVFGRAKTFTIIKIEKKKVKNIEVIQNPAVSYNHGAGPIVVKMLTDKGVNTVVAGEFGPGVSTLLEHFNVAKIEVERGKRVTEAIKQFLK